MPIDDDFEFEELELVSEENDCIIKMRTWLSDRKLRKDNYGNELIDPNERQIKFIDIEKGAGLEKGSAVKYIEKAAIKVGYEIDQIGNTMVLLKYAEQQ